MSLDLGSADEQPLEHVDELVAWMRGGEKPRDRWLVGVEHEKLGLTKEGGPVLYAGEDGIRALLVSLSRRGVEGTLHEEAGNPIAWLEGKASVTLEPGGQLELSGSPFRTLAEVEREIDAHLAAVRAWSAPRGIKWLALGYRPEGSTGDAPWMPKLRYGAMRESLGPRGRLAPDMMLMTSTVQANLDFSDEEDLARKVRAATRVSPIVTALFANSPLRGGKDSGLLDFRYQVWRETDPARCGLLEVMLRPDFGTRAYVEWALDVPLLFVRFEGRYLDGQGQTFRQWMRSGSIAGLALRPTLSHFTDHLTTLFPEVRVKRVIELRGADVVPRPYLLALPALWMGLLYDPGASEAAAALTGRWTFAELLEFQAQVAQKALAARGPDGRTALELARELVELARQGLGAWKAISGSDERPYLEPIAALARGGKTLAEQALEAWRVNPSPAALIPACEIA
jgi:glutamate--cysteine ligase